MTHLEPMVTLPDGTTVYQATHDLIADLLEHGHVVSVSRQGVVTIQPAVDDECTCALQQNVAATRALLAALQQVH